MSVRAELPGLPEISRERAERALGLLRLAVLEKIRNATLTPIWLDASRFWYQRDGDQGAQFVIVDATTGDIQNAFDHAAVAAALSAASGTAVTADKLPLRSMAANAERLAVTFAIAGQSYVWREDEVALASQATSPPPRGARTSPDGQLALFVRDHELWIHAIGDGGERRLTAGGGPRQGFALVTDQMHFGRIQRNRQDFTSPPPDIRWSPDSRRLIAASTDERGVEPYPFVEHVPVDGSYRPRLHELRLILTGDPPVMLDYHVIDVETGKLRVIDFPDAIRPTTTNDIIRVWWSEDCDRAFILARDPNMTILYLVDVDVSTGATRVIIADDTMPGRVFGEGGGSPPAIAILDGSDEFVWLSYRDGWHHLFLHDLTSGAVKRRLTVGDWLVRELLHVDTKNRVLIVTGTGREMGNPYHRYVYKIGLDDRELALLTPETGDHIVAMPIRHSGATACGISPDGDYLVYGTSSAGDPGDYRLRRTLDGALVKRLETVDASALFNAGYRPPEEFTAKTADGSSTLHGLVYRPSDHDRTQRYPVIDVQYGSPIAAITPRSFLASAANVIGFTNCAALAELGFVVVVVDAAGTPGRNEAFSRPQPGYLAHMGLDDHIAFMRAVATDDPSVDLERSGISGISFGGWTTFRAMLRYPDFFKVGVSGAGPGSFQSMWTAPTLVLPHGSMLYGGCRERPSPTAIPDSFHDIDNIAEAGRLRGRLLLVVGEHDENVPPASTLQFYDALLKHDKDVDLILLPNGTHGGIYRAHVLRRECSWFLEHLAGQRFPGGLMFTSPLPEVQPSPDQR